MKKVKTKKKTDRKEYLSAYYKKRKEEIAQKKKERYANDPEYREAIRKSAIKFNKKKNKARLAKVAKGELPKRAKPEFGQFFVMIGDKDTELFKMAKLIEVTGLSKSYLRNLITNGKIPRTPFRTDGGSFLYSYGMILVIKGALHANFKNPTDSIIQGWASLGVTAVDK